MSPKHSTPVTAPIVPHCQYISARGHRCRMLVDKNHSSLCPFHLVKNKAKGPAPDPEVVAAELLGGIEDFDTADDVNLFLGNLVKQLARKRIARRDAIALAYISQLVLNSLTAMAKDYEVEKYEEGTRDFLEDFLRTRATSPAGQQSSESATCETIGRNP